MNDSLLTEQPETIDINKNYLEDLVGENKKFKSVEDLAKGKAESDLYIKTLTDRQDELRRDYLRLKEDYESRAKLEELIDQMTLKQQQQLASSDNTQSERSEVPVYDPKQIESLVSSKIQEHESGKRHQENYNLVRSKLQERYGNSYQNVLKQHIEDLDLTEEDVNRMARIAPKALLRTLGLDQPVQQQPFQSPPRSAQRSDSFAPSVGNKRTWSYYQNMKREKPELYNDPKTTVQMHKDYIELGNAFEDGDFNT